MAAAVSFTLAACASGIPSAKPSTTSDAKPNLGSVVVARTILSPYILADIAVNQSLDTKYGVTIVPTDYQSTATEIPQVLQGKFNIGIGGSADVMTAVAAGIPIKIIGSVAAVASASASDSVAALVTADPAVKTVADLANKPIAVNSLKTYNSLSATAAVLASGVALKDIKFVALPTSSQLAALSKQQVSAAVLQEPFVTQALDAGFRILAGLGTDIGVGTPTFAYFVSAEWADSHKKELAAATAALADAAKLAIKDPGLFRDEVLKAIKTPGDVGPRMRLPKFAIDIPVAQYDKIGSYLVKAEYVTKMPKASTFVIYPK